MSFSAVRSYFRTHLNALGYNEWTDAFNIENNPSSILDSSYHLGPIGVSPIQQNQNDLETDASISVNLWFAGYLDPAAALDNATANAQSILIDVLKASNRIGSDIKNVFFESMTFEPIAASNDNVVRLKLDFRCRVIIGIE